MFLQNLDKPMETGDTSKSKYNAIEDYIIWYCKYAIQYCTLFDNLYYLFTGYGYESKFIVPRDNHFFTKSREIVATKGDNKVAVVWLAS